MPFYMYIKRVSTSSPYEPGVANLKLIKVKRVEELTVTFEGVKREWK
jgi:hypothetical protein